MTAAGHASFGRPFRPLVDQATKRKALAGLVATIALINLAVWAISGYSLSSSRASILQRVDATTRNLTQLIELDISSILDRSAVAVGVVTRRMEEDLRAGRIERGHLWSIVDDATTLVPEMRQVGVFDADGQQVCGVPVLRCLGLNVADRAYFTRHRQAPNDAAPLLTGPLRSRVDDEWALVLSRAIMKPDGGFGGIVLALIPVRHFKGLFERLDLGRDGAVNLRTAELVQVARHPGPVRSEDERVNRKVSAELADAVKAEPRGGLYKAPTAIDGIERRNAYRKFARYPLYILVGLSSADYLAEWQGDVGWTALSCLIFALVTGILGTLLYFALARWWESSERISAIAEQQRAMLDSEVFAAIRTRDHRIVWASRSFATMFGYSQEELAGMPTRLFYDDGESAEGFGPAVLAATERGETVARHVDTVRKDGRPLHLLASVSRSALARDEHLCIFVDASEQREAQRLLVEREALFRGLFEQSGFLAGILDESGVVLEVNGRALEAIGAARDAIVGRAFADTPYWDNPADRERLRQAVGRAREGLSDSFETTHRHRDGSLLHVMFHTMPEKLPSGALRIVAIGVDITERHLSEDALQAESQRLRLASEAGGVGVFDLEVRTGRAWRSASHAAIFGHAPDGGSWSLQRFLDLVVPADRPAVAGTIRDGQAAGTQAFECRIRRADGLVRWIAVRAERFEPPDGTGPHMIGTVIDVTERRVRDDLLRFQGEVLRQMQEGVILVKTGTREIVFANGMFEEMFGYGPGELLGKDLSILNAPDEADPASVAYRITSELARRGTWEGDLHSVKKDGTVFWTHAAISTLRHGEHGEVWICVQGDIDARKHLEMNLKEANALLGRLAVRDALTGLFNRRYFEETLAREMEIAKRNARPLSLVLFDIDRFKQVNDTLGHQAGDTVLKALGTLLQASSRGGDVACRYGGEEFLLLLPGATGAAARQRAEGIRLQVEALRIPCDDAGEVAITLSAGIACYPADCATPGDLVQCADQALYAAKAAGRNCTRLAFTLGKPRG